MIEREEKPLRDQLRKATEEKEQLREKVLIWQIVALLILSVALMGSCISSETMDGKKEDARVQKGCFETRTDYLLTRQECAGVLGDSPSINKDPWRVSNWDKNLKELRIRLGDPNFQYNP